MVKHRAKYIVAVLLAVILMFGLLSGYVMQASATEPTYTVTFTFDGTEILSESVNKGETVTTVPAADSQTGYTITGWYIKGYESNVYSSSEVAAFSIRANTEFCAVYTPTYEVTFTFDGTKITSESVNKGETVTTVPAADSQTGYTITGWYIKGYESNVYSSSEVAAFSIRANTEFCAVYTPTYEVTFTFDGTKITSESVNKGETVTTVPAADSQTGYTITGWYIKGYESNVYSSSEVAAFSIRANTEFCAVYEQTGSDSTSTSGTGSDTTSTTGTSGTGSDTTSATGSTGTTDTTATTTITDTTNGTVTTTSTTTDSSSTSTVKTGVEDNLVFYVMAIILGMGVAVPVMVKRRKMQ